LQLYPNCIYEDTKNGLNFENTCYASVYTPEAKKMYLIGHI